jgi:hypothetical protein
LLPHKGVVCDILPKLRDEIKWTFCRKYDILPKMRDRVKWTSVESTIYFPK